MATAGVATASTATVEDAILAVTVEGGTQAAAAVDMVAAVAMQYVAAAQFAAAVAMQYVAAVVEHVAAADVAVAVVDVAAVDIASWLDAA
jgi:hypothetical protein